MTSLLHEPAVCVPAFVTGMAKPRPGEVTRCETCGAARSSCAGVEPAGSSISTTAVAPRSPATRTRGRSAETSPAARLRPIVSCSSSALTSRTGPLSGE